MKWPFSSKREPLENLGPGDSVIVVIGPTGVGKSSFINTAADERLEVDSGRTSPLSPCTTEFAYVRCTFEDSRQVVFVDTPAFPDPYSGNPNLSAEKKVGKKISEWLKEAFGKHIKVTGILYLHNISNNRLTEPLPHYEIFRKLCGNQYPASVVLVLTMCEKVNPTIYQDRKEYLTTHWKKMMGEKAAGVYSHNGTKKSAWDVVTALGVL